MAKKDDIEKIKEKAKQLEDLILNADDVLPADYNLGVNIKKLNAKELAFCVHYARFSNSHEASLAAGYVDRYYGNKLLQEEHIQLEVARRTYFREAALLVNKDTIMSELVQLIYEARMDSKTDRATILKALDMMNKMNGNYAPDTQINVQNNILTTPLQINIITPNGNKLGPTSEAV